VYSLIRPLLFTLDAEHSHDLTLGLMRGAYRLPGISTLVRRRYAGHSPPLPVEVMGLRFPNPVGLAAGLDKEAQSLAALFDFGFGFLELGTDAAAAIGHPKPRRFAHMRHHQSHGFQQFRSRCLCKSGRSPRAASSASISANKLTPDAEGSTITSPVCAPGAR
jgi:hypothetical protein